MYKYAFNVDVNKDVCLSCVNETKSFPGVIVKYINILISATWKKGDVLFYYSNFYIGCPFTV